VKALTSIALATGLALSLSAAANATPTLVGTTTDPTGINNLVVDSAIYDVTFSTTTLNSFTKGSTLSLDADTALAAALNALSVTGLGNFTASGTYGLVIDNSLSSFDAPACTAPCLSGDWFASFGSGFTSLGSSSGGFFYLQAADFSAVSTTGVPEPFTLSFFGAGLLGAAAMRRRNARK